MRAFLDEAEPVDVDAIVAGARDRAVRRGGFRMVPVVLGAALVLLLGVPTLLFLTDADDVADPATTVATTTPATAVTTTTTTTPRTSTTGTTVVGVEPGVWVPSDPPLIGKGRDGRPAVLDPSGDRVLVVGSEEVFSIHLVAGDWSRLATTTSRPSNIGEVFWFGEDRLGYLAWGTMQGLWSLDLTTGEWEQLAGTTFVPHAAAFDSMGGRVVAISRQRYVELDEIPDGWVSLTACQCASWWEPWVYDEANETWSVGSVLPEPIDTSQVSMVFEPVSGRVIVLAWGADPYSEDRGGGVPKMLHVWAYSPGADEWTRLASPELLRMGMFSWRAPPTLDPEGGRILVHDLPEEDRTFWAMDLATERWVALDVPGLLDPLLYLGFGDGESLVAVTARAVWHYSIGTGEWTPPEG
jgi:hypothetical protein